MELLILILPGMPEDSIREAVFKGNREGMPHWGIVGLSYGAVDAVAQYIADGLPEG